MTSCCWRTDSDSTEHTRMRECTVMRKNVETVSYAIAEHYHGVDTVVL